MTAVVNTQFKLSDEPRGVAALGVVAYHFGGGANLPAMVPRGYLAKDLLFAIDGFVLQTNYGDWLRATLTAGRFVVFCLWPALLPGTLSGAFIELGRPVAGRPAGHLADLAWNQHLYLFIDCLFLLAAAVCLASLRVFRTTFMRAYFISAGVPSWQLGRRLACLPYPEIPAYANCGSAGNLPVIDGCCGAIIRLLICAAISGPSITSVTFFFLPALPIACLVRVESASVGRLARAESAPERRHAASDCIMPASATRYSSRHWPLRMSVGISRRFARYSLSG